jgi:hypothetical protein
MVGLRPGFGVIAADLQARSMRACLSVACLAFANLGRLIAQSRQSLYMRCEVVHNAPIFPPLPPMTNPKQIRLTISVSPDVHSAFERLSAASGNSMSKCMGEWLSDTLEAVEYTALMVEKARLAPKMVMREVHAYALGLADETGTVLRSLRDGGRAGAGMAQPPSAGPTSMSPPSCNTGGKVPNRGKRTSGGKAS